MENVTDAPSPPVGPNHGSDRCPRSTKIFMLLGLLSLAWIAVTPFEFRIGRGPELQLALPILFGVIGAVAALRQGNRTWAVLSAISGFLFLAIFLNLAVLIWGP